VWCASWLLNCSCKLCSLRVLGKLLHGRHVGTNYIANTGFPQNCHPCSCAYSWQPCSPLSPHHITSPSGTSTGEVVLAANLATPVRQQPSLLLRASKSSVKVRRTPRFFYRLRVELPWYFCGDLRIPRPFTTKFAAARLPPQERSQSWVETCGVELNPRGTHHKIFPDAGVGLS